MATAEALFRRLGFAKTTVADIAADLRMSPANIYRYFDSKNAIVQAICRRCLLEVEDRAWAVARSKGPAAQRMERLILEILAYHKANLVTEHRVNELVVAAIEHSWETIRSHKNVMRNVVELVVRDGIDAGEFDPLDPRETADLIMRSVVYFTNPLVVGQCLEEGEDLEAQARASVRFLLRAITPRR
jgi:AcrR family transcriptional regulator